MSKLYNQAVFIDKTTKNVIWRLTSKPFNPKFPGFNKFYWEKEKLVILDKLIKDRFLDKRDIEIRDYSGVLENE